VRQGKFGPAKAIVRVKQPSTAARLDRVKPVARDRLRHESNECLSIFLYEVVQRTLPIELRSERIGVHHVHNALPRDLYRRIADGSPEAKYSFNANDSFGADHGNLGSRTIGHGENEGAQTLTREIDLTQRFVTFLEDLTASQRPKGEER
jgi:hypothetical protein